MIRASGCSSISTRTLRSISLNIASRPALIRCNGRPASIADTTYDARSSDTQNLDAGDFAMILHTSLRDRPPREFISRNNRKISLFRSLAYSITAPFRLIILALD